jgi:hypothetical protein
MILVPRFRIDAVTVLNPKLQEIGVLDKETAGGLLSLKKRILHPFRTQYLSWLAKKP